MGAVADVELGAMQRAHQHRPPKPALAQRRVGMGAVVFEGVELATDPAHDNAVSTDVGEGPKLAVGDARQVTEIDGFAQLSSGPMAR